MADAIFERVSSAPGTSLSVVRCQVGLVVASFWCRLTGMPQHGTDTLTRIKRTRHGANQTSTDTNVINAPPHFVARHGSTRHLANTGEHGTSQHATRTNTEGSQHGPTQSTCAYGQQGSTNTSRAKTKAKLSNDPTELLNTDFVAQEACG